MLTGEDKLLTISNTEGDTLRTAPLRGEPSDLQFSEMKTDERASGENTVFGRGRWTGWSESEKERWKDRSEIYIYS